MAQTLNKDVKNVKKLKDFIKYYIYAKFHVHSSSK